VPMVRNIQKGVTEMTTLNTITKLNDVYRAFYSDETSLIISRPIAESLSRVYNVKIEADDDYTTDEIVGRLIEIGGILNANNEIGDSDELAEELEKLAKSLYKDNS